MNISSNRITYSKTCVKWPLSENCFQEQLLLNAGQKYCRMLQREHSAILWTFIKLPLRSLFCLFLCGRFIQVLLYKQISPAKLKFILKKMMLVKDIGRLTRLKLCI